MKTYYRIIWVDDDMDTTAIDQEDVTEFLDDHGIRADITPVQAPSDGSVHEKLNDLLQDEELDLLLVDFNMDGLRGDELVNLIRNSDHVYLPVIFYSSSPVEELFDAVKSSQLDGVYIANRDQLIIKFKAVVESLLVKEHTIKRTRGLLMEGVSEIDARFGGIFAQALAQLEEKDKEALRKYLEKIAQERAQSAEKAMERFPADVAAFEEHMASNYMTKAYDTYTRWRIFSKALELLKHDEEVRNVLKEFADSKSDVPALNSLRNNYAHQTRAELDASHSDSQCIDIRRQLRRHQANIEKIDGQLPG